MRASDDASCAAGGDGRRDARDHRRAVSRAAQTRSRHEARAFRPDEPRSRSNERRWMENRDERERERRERRADANADANAAHPDAAWVYNRVKPPSPLTPIKITEHAGSHTRGSDETCVFVSTRTEDTSVEARTKKRRYVCGNRGSCASPTPPTGGVAGRTARRRPRPVSPAGSSTSRTNARPDVLRRSRNAREAACTRRRTRRTSESHARRKAGTRSRFETERHFWSLALFGFRGSARDFDRRDGNSCCESRWPLTKYPYGIAD